MKQILILVSLASAILGAPARSVNAQETRAPAEIQKEYGRFFADFRVALKANDAPAVTRLTAFPFHWNENRDAAYFEKKLYPQIFGGKVRRCLATAKGVYARDPSGRETFSHFCGEQLFLFARTPEGFRFIEVGAND